MECHKEEAATGTRNMPFYNRWNICHGI